HESFETALFRVLQKLPATTQPARPIRKTRLKSGVTIPNTIHSAPRTIHLLFSSRSASMTPLRKRIAGPRKMKHPERKATGRNSQGQSTGSGCSNRVESRHELTIPCTSGPEYLSVTVLNRL